MRWRRLAVFSALMGMLICLSFARAVTAQSSASAEKPRQPMPPAGNSGPPRLVVQTGSPDEPDALVFSPNRQILASGSSKAVTLWDIESGSQLRVIPGAGSTLAFTPDGTRIVGLTNEEGTDKNSHGVAVIWDVATGREVARIRCQVECWLNFSAISFDARLVATSTLKDTVAICDLGAKGTVRELAKQPHSVSEGAFSRQGKLFAAASREDTVELWDVQTGQHLQSFQGNGGRLFNLMFSPDGKSLAGSGHGGIVVWDVSGHMPSRRLEKVATEVRTLDFAPDGETLVGTCFDNTIRTWDLSTGRQLATFPGNSYGTLPVRFSPDGLFLATREDHAIKMWAVRTGREYRRFQGKSLEIRATAFSPDGRTIALGDNAGDVHLWGAVRGQFQRTLTGHKAQIMHLAFSPDGRWLVDSSWDDTVHVWDLTTVKLAHLFPRESPPLRRDFGKLVTPEDDHDPVWKLAFSPNSKLMAAAGEDRIRVWEVGTWKRKFVLSGHSGSVRSVLFTADGKQILTSGGHWGHGRGKGEVRVWRAADGRFVQELPSRFTAFWWLTTPPRPKPGTVVWLAAVSGDAIALWNLQTRKELRALVRPTDTSMPPEIASSPDGKFLAAGYDDGNLCLWDAATGHLLDSVTLHASSIASVAFSPDGKHLLTGSQDGTARLWAILSGRVQPLCSLYMFRNGTWAVVDAKGYFDGSNRGDVAELHWVTDTTNKEVIPLKQWKDQYYTPGLLAKYLGFTR